MKIINLYGGPGAGKTTMAYYLAYRLKAAGFRAELVGEAARELIYDRNPGMTAAQLLDNQLLVSGLQYERFKRLERHGIEVAIADSPLRLGLVYAAGLPEEHGLRTAIYALDGQMGKTINVFVVRTPGVYDKESRAQTEEQAIELDRQAFDIAYSRNGRLFDYQIVWGQEHDLADAIIEELKNGRN